MSNTTYLFGAGASADALPIVKQIPDTILETIDYLKAHNSEFGDDKFEKGLNLSKREYLEELISDLNWLLEGCKTHSSVDTYAKKLFLKRKESDLYKLKLTLSIFFIIQQKRSRFDLRYDTFFASILSTDIYTLPSNIKIISWNYDYQFEIAFSGYSDDDKLSVNQDLLKITWKYKDYHPSSGFIYKLNGTTALYKNDNARNQFILIDTFKHENDINFIASILRNYAAAKQNMNEIHPALSFAWESDNNSENVIYKAIKAAEATDYLVVVGYSFPYFNRAIDKALITKMTHLKRVYFQSPDPENLRDRFLSLRDKRDLEFVCIKDTSQFFLPNELSI